MKRMKKWRYYILSVALLAVLCSLGFLGTNSVSAASVTNVLANQTRYNKNASATDSYYNTSGTLPLTIYTGTGHTGFWDFSNNVVFANPGGSTSTNSYVAEATVTFTANAPIVNGNISRYASLTSIRPEGVSLSALQPGSSTTVDITALSSYSITFKIRQVGLLASNVNVTNWLIGINYSPETIFWCSSDSSQTCSSNITLTLNSLDFNVTFETSQTDSLLQTQVNQNQTIINQNQQQIEQDQQDREDIENQKENTEDEASNKGEEAEEVGTTLFAALATLIGALTNVHQTNCNLTMPTINMQGTDINLGTLNLCENEVPNELKSLGSLMLVFLIVPMGINCAKRMLGLYNELLGGK